MLKRFKHFLWSNRYTKKLYRTLWHLKHEGIGAALEYWEKGEKRGKKKKRKNKKDRTKTYHYEMIHSMWRTSGAANSMMNQLEFYSQIDWCWRNENKRLWLIYISCLIERGENEKAHQILRQYISIHQLNDIERFLPVAAYANEIGIKSEKIEISSQILSVLENNLKKNVFYHLVKGKRIAIVGNAGCELGLKKGPEIDSHDIVIRFNNYPCKYIEDYGEKTNIWVRCANISVEDRDISPYQLVIWEPDYLHMEVQHNHLDILEKEISQYPERVMFIDNVIKKGVQETSKSLNPTTGCYLMWMLYQALGTFRDIDIYGFSFLYDDGSYEGHYYDDLSTMNVLHNMNLERPFLRNLFFENGGKVSKSEMHLTQ